VTGILGCPSEELLMIFRITTGDENYSPPREGYRGGVVLKWKDPPRRLRLLPLPRGDFQRKAGN
jgi:hypothetical protein